MEQPENEQRNFATTFKDSLSVEKVNLRELEDAQLAAIDMEDDYPCPGGISSESLF